MFTNIFNVIILPNVRILYIITAALKIVCSTKSSRCTKLVNVLIKLNNSTDNVNDKNNKGHLKKKCIKIKCVVQKSRYFRYCSMEELTYSVIQLLFTNFILYFVVLQL